MSVVLDDLFPGYGPEFVDASCKHRVRHAYNKKQNTNQRSNKDLSLHSTKRTILFFHQGNSNFVLFNEFIKSSHSVYIILVE